MKNILTDFNIKKVIIYILKIEIVIFKVKNLNECSYVQNQNFFNQKVFLLIVKVTVIAIVLLANMIENAFTSVVFCTLWQR